LLGAVVGDLAVGAELDRTVGLSVGQTLGKFELGENVVGGDGGVDACDEDILGDCVDVISVGSIDGWEVGSGEGVETSASNVALIASET